MEIAAPRTMVYAMTHLAIAQLAEGCGMPAANIPVFLDMLAQQSIHQGDLDPSMSESGVDSRVLLEASNKGIHLWRNNRGAGKIQLKEGRASRFMRWGLANDSEKLGAVIKSGDRIGIRRIRITPVMVGAIVGQFVSREIKRADWKYSGSIEDCAQLQWAALINAQGGDAKIVTGLGSFD